MFDIHTDYAYCKQIGNKFTQERVDWLKDVYTKLNPKVIQVIDDMLFSHGTVTNKFLQKYPETLSSKELVDAARIIGFLIGQDVALILGSIATKMP